MLCMALYASQRWLETAVGARRIFAAQLLWENMMYTSLPLRCGFPVMYGPPI